MSLALHAFNYVAWRGGWGRLGDEEAFFLKNFKIFGWIESL